MAEATDGRHVVADEDDGAPSRGHVRHHAKALLLESSVADGQHFVHGNDVRIEVGGHGKRETHVHSTAIALDRRVHELLDFGEGDDLVQLCANLLPVHAQDCTVEEDVLPPSQIRMKPRADFQHAGHAATESDRPRGRSGDAREQPQEGGFARSVPAHQPHDLARRHLEAGVPKSPHVRTPVLAVGRQETVKEVTQVRADTTRAQLSKAVALRKTLGGDGVEHYLDCIDESAAGPTEKGQPHRENDPAGAQAVDHPAAGHGTDAKGSTAKGFDEGTHGIEHQPPPMLGRHERSGIHDRSRVHQQAGPEVHGVREVLVPRRQRCDQGAQAQAEGSGDGQNQRHGQDPTAQRNVMVTNSVHDGKAGEENETDEIEQ